MIKYVPSFLNFPDIGSWEQNQILIFTHYTILNVREHMYWIQPI